MPYPERLLSPGEQVETEFRPHWKVLIVPAVALIVGIVVAVVLWSSLEGTARPVLAALALLAGLFVGARQWTAWLFTKYIVTNERLIIREGLIARRGKEIPLERIDNVSYSQTVGERILRSGDLIIESAGEGGQSRYTDIPRPEDTQSLIYQFREARLMAIEGGVAVSKADEIEKLARLWRDGVLTDAEFEAKKQKLLDEI
ncbi:MAG: PH domain-containing protein [Acidimicrobiia bacterium]|nr:PH domain-containing protein [Acidimicrobiia bacterium]